jgi:3-hydroxyacyl-CoA dehydrogenase/enoyl-CoA hydratase/3-hydroxybutyryl-CoA epimerase
MIFGTGFAPFRGGPIQYAKDRGVIEVVSTLEKFSQKYGERFKPCVGWDLLLETSGKLLTNGNHNA